MQRLFFALKHAMVGTGTAGLIVLVLTVLAVSCGERELTAAKGGKNRRHVDVDYFSGEKVRSVQHTNYILIDDDTTRWVPVLYQQKNFEAIERHVLGLMAEKTESGAYELYLLYNVLGAITDDKHIDRMLQVLNEWCSLQPESHIPLLVRGKFRISHAWSIRGGGWAKSVSKEAWKGFYSELEAARKDLERSWHQNPGDPNSSCFLMTAARGLKLPREDMERYYQAGSSSIPWHYGLQTEKLEYLKPKWHGSREEMFDFARHCLGLSGQYPFFGLLMVSAYEELFRYYSKETQNPDYEKVWPLIESIYNEFFKKYPDDLRRRFFFAYHAYLFRKYDAAFSQFEILGDRWMEHTRWDSLSQYNRSRAICLAKKGEVLLIERKLYEMSIDYLQKAVDLYPSDYTFYRLGQAYMYSGISTGSSIYYSRAETALKEAVKLKGPNSEFAAGELKLLRKYWQ